MHHELFLALLGHAGDVIEAKSDGFLVREDVDFLSPPQKTMINRLLILGYNFAKLETFVKTAQQLPSIYVRGLAQGVEKVLQQYADVIVRLESKILTTKITFPIPQMVYEMEEFMELLPELSKLVCKLQVGHKGTLQKDSCLGGAQLLEVLHRATSSGFPRIRRCMQELQHHCHKILFKQILAWILYGDLVDPYSEFFIKKNPVASKKQTAAEEDTSESALVWQTQFSIDLDAIPLSYFPISVAESILFIGKSLQILVRANEFSVEEAQEVVDVIRSLAIKPAFDTVAVEHAVEKVRQHVANRLHKEVVIKSDFVKYLAVLKDFFLLSRGELFQAFIERSFTMMTMKPTHKTEDLNHGIWSQTIREFLTDSDSPWNSQFSIQLPLQSFAFKGFSTLEGLVCAGVSKDSTRKLLQVQSMTSNGSNTFPTATATEECGAVWWRHAQFDATAFAADFTIQLLSMELRSSLPRRRVALIFSNDGSFDTPTLVNGSFVMENLDGSYVTVEFDLVDVDDVGHVVIVSKIKASKNQQEEVRMSSPTAVPLVDSGTLQFQIQYARQEVKGASLTQVIYKKVMAITANGVVLLEVQFDLQQALQLRTISSEYWLGIAITRGICLSEWNLEKYSSKARWKEGDNLRDDNQSLTPRELWNYLSLRCDVHWPLQLLVTPDLLGSYSHLFQFCFRLKRVAHALELTWKSGALRSKTMTHPPFAACALRSRMSFVIRNVEMYFQVFIIESSFSKCVADIIDASDFDRVKRIHEAFVATLIKKCYVHTKTVMSALDDVINCCWKFVEYVIYQDATQTSGLSADRITLLEQDFHTRFEFFYGVLQHSDARDLLFLLDYNEYFSTERERRKQQRPI